MFLIIVYDVNVDRVDKIRVFLKRYLNWIQNSVFEGEVTKSQYKEITSFIDEFVEKAEDSVYIFRINNKKWIKKSIIGVEKGSTSRIL